MLENLEDSRLGFAYWPNDDPEQPAKFNSARKIEFVYLAEKYENVVELGRLHLT